MFQFMWEYMDYILQNETTLSFGANEAIRWSPIGDMDDGSIHAQFPLDEALEPNFLIMFHFNELS